MHFTSGPSPRDHPTGMIVRAILAGGVVEEAAQASINAERIGGPVAIPEDMRASALQRAMAFEQAGVRHA